MLDFLKKTEIIDEMNYANEMMCEVEPFLAKRRREDFFLSRDGKKLYYEAYEKKFSKGNIIILHGFCESAEKFREMAYYFCKDGYNVFVPDMRGHGKSWHDSEKKEMVDISSFDVYADELDIFIRKIVNPVSEGKDIYLYAHSLGSTVVLLYLMKHHTFVSKVVLSSPMICGNMGMPVGVASAAAKLLCGIGGKKIPAPGRCSFNPLMPFEEGDAASMSRFLYYHEKRKKEPRYQTSGPSFSWVKASVDAKNTLLSEEVRNINAKMLIFLPEEDKQLLSEYTEEFARITGTKIKRVKKAKHEIFMSKNEELGWYLNEIRDFLE